MKKVNSIIIVLCLFLFSCNTITHLDNDVLVSKQTVQKSFRFSLKENLDSFKIIMPNVIDWKWSNEYLETRISPIKFIAQKEGIPSLNELKMTTYNLPDVQLFKIKYKPKLSNIIDSITFTFNRYEGSSKISSFEVFEHDEEIFKKIKTLP